MVCLVCLFNTESRYTKANQLISSEGLLKKKKNNELISDEDLLDWLFREAEIFFVQMAQTVLHQESLRHQNLVVYEILQLLESIFTGF